MAFNARIVCGSIVTITLAGLLRASALESGALPYDEPVVPVGQEELLSTMLGRGAALPDGCKFAGGGADGPLIRSTYACPSGEVVYHVVHPDNATDSAIQTERFAIMVESGAPPTSLAEALASLLRSHEGEFEWAWLTSEDDELP